MRSPLVERYRPHVLVCVGGFCSPDRRGRALYAQFASLLEREGLLFGPQRVKRSEANERGRRVRRPRSFIEP